MPSYKDEKTGKWFVSFYYTDSTGKRARKVKRGFNLKRDADKWEREFLTSDHPTEVTFGVVLESFLKNLESRQVQGKIKKGTLAAYKKRISYYIKPFFEGAIVSKIKNKDIDEWMAELTELPDKPLKENSRYYKDFPDKVRKTKRSSNTINEARSLLSRIFEYGKKNFGTTNNPVTDTERIPLFSQDKRAKLWTLEQYNVFRNSLEREDMKVIFDIMFFAGLRIGETVALTISDISEYAINVDKGLVQIEYDDEFIDTPKNRKARIVEVPVFLYDEIQAYANKNYHLLPNEILFPIKEATIRTHLNTQTRKCNLPLISPHILRHSYASYLLNLSGDATAVAKQLGHSNPSVTLKIYSHMLPQADRSAVDALEKLATEIKK